MRIDDPLLIEAFGSPIEVQERPSGLRERRPVGAPKIPFLTSRCGFGQNPLGDIALKYVGSVVTLSITEA